MTISSVCPSVWYLSPDRLCWLANGAWVYSLSVVCSNTVWIPERRDKSSLIGLFACPRLRLGSSVEPSLVSSFGTKEEKKWGVCLFGGSNYTTGRLFVVGALVVIDSKHGFFATYLSLIITMIFWTCCSELSVSGDELFVAVAVHSFLGWERLSWLSNFSFVMLINAVLVDVGRDKYLGRYSVFPCQYGFE